MQLGPLDYAQFRRFQPDGDAFQAMAQLVRTYAGMEYAFEIQPILRRDEVPWCVLGGEQAACNLGWNTWSRNGDCREDVADCVFFVDDRVSCGG